MPREHPGPDSRGHCKGQAASAGGRTSQVGLVEGLLAALAALKGFFGHSAGVNVVILRMKSNLAGSELTYF